MDSEVDYTEGQNSEKDFEIQQDSEEDYEDGRLFKQLYRCYPVSVIQKDHLENGDKIIMPTSALQRLAFSVVEYPMLFELNNLAAGRVTHCGVLEFVADEGVIYIPSWMMENMLLKGGDTVQVKNVGLAKATYAKLQPHTRDFWNLSNPKAILETTLRSYTCITTGDTIMVCYNQKNYYINVIETKPSSAVSIVETDCEVDFAAPLDYREPEKPTSTLLNKTPLQVEEEPANKMSKLRPFTGSARRLDGQPSLFSSQSVTSASSLLLNGHQLGIGNGTKVTKSPSLCQSSAKPGKLVFGSNVRQSPTVISKAAMNNSSQEPSQKTKETKFEAFTGKKYLLKD